MATNVKTSTPDLSSLLGIPVQMADADQANASEIRSSRGRQEGQDVVALRQILRESLESGKAKVFENVTDKKVRETLVRKIRQASKGAGVDGSDIKVSTSYNSTTGNLFWGPKTVIDKIVGRNGSSN